MSFDVTTLALAKSYADQHGGGDGGTSTADGISYTNEYLVGTTNVKGALDVLVPKSHDHDNKDALDKLSVSNGKLQYNGSNVGLKGDKGADGKSAYQYAVEGGYIGTEKNFAEKLAYGFLTIEITESNGTLSADKTWNDVEWAIYNGKIVLAHYNDSLFSFIEKSDGNMYFGMTMCLNDETGAVVGSEIIEITSGGEVNYYYDNVEIPKTLPNPNALTFAGDVTGSYDGSAAMTVNIPSAVTDDHINSLIDAKLGVIENGSY